MNKQIKLKAKTNTLIGLVLSSLAVSALTFAINQKDNEIRKGPAIAETLSEDQIKHNVRFQSTYTPTDTYYSTQKGYSMSTLGDIESVWDDYKGDGITIAVIDTGIDHDHPDFTDSNGVNHISDRSRYYYTSGTKVYYYNATSQSDYTGSEYGWDYLQHDYDSTKKVYSYHGTNVAGSAAASDNGIGTIGIAPNATILAIKTDMLLTSINAAINYAVSEGVDVINMSLAAYAESFTDGNGTAQTGYSTTASALTSAINSAYNKGIIVVAAAGNEKTSYYSYPASNNHVIGVGALAKNSDKTAASFSNFNKSTDTASGNHNVDLMAPGYVYAPSYDGSHTYVATQGTSFASPIVAGTAALWKQKNPNKTPDDFMEDLYATCNDMGETGWDTTYGYGSLDVGALMELSYSVTGVELNCGSTATVLSNSKLELVATVSPKNAANKAVTWTSSDKNVATVSSTGVVTPIKEGTTRITVTTADGGFTDYVDVTVTPYVSSEFTCSVNNSSMHIGDKEQINITWSNTNPSNTLLLYESSDTSVATVSDSGLITAVGLGNTTISIMSSDDTQSLDISVVEEANYEWVLCETDSYLTIGDKYVLANKANGKVAGTISSDYLTAVDATFSGTNKDVISTLPSDAEIFTLGGESGAYTLTCNSNNKLLTYNGTNLSYASTNNTFDISISNGTALVKAGSYNITYNSSSPRFKPYSSSQKDVQLFVKEYIGDKTLTSISLSGQTTDYFVGDKFSFDGTVTATYSNGRSVVVTPTSVTTPDMSTAGTKTITVTYTDDYGTQSVTYTINVVAVKITSISTSGQTTAYIVGDTFSYDGTCTASYNNGDTSVVTPTVDNSEVDMSKAGSYTITLTYEGMTTTYTITVSEKPTTTTLDIDFTNSNNSDTDNEGNVWTATSCKTGNYLGFTSSSSSVVKNTTPLLVDTSKTITVSGYVRTYGSISNASFNVIGYNSSGKAVTNTGTLTPNSSTLTNTTCTLTFTDTSDNQITIKVTSTKSGSNKYLGLSTMSVVYTKGIEGPKVTAFSLDKTTLSLDIYNKTSDTLTPNITADEGADTTVTWLSSDESIATVNNGVVTAVKVGNAIITAKCGNLSATCNVTITDSTPLVIESFVITPSATTVAFKEELSLSVTATVNYTNGTSKVVTPDSTNYDVDTSLLGEHVISATYQGITATATITVTNKNATPITGDGTWNLVTDASTLNVNDKIIIVASGSNYALSTTQNENNRDQAAVSKNTSNNTVTFTSSVQEITLENGSEDGTFAFNVGDEYLYAASSTKNYLKTQSSIDANASWTISISSGVATITAQGSNTYNLLKYNSSSKIFSCYKSGQSPVAIYKLTSSISSWTGTDQAIAFANYFLNVTSPICASADDHKAQLEKVWTNLANEYGYMINDAKDDFVDNTTNNEIIQEAQQRYQIIINNYNLNNFATKADGTSSLASNNIKINMTFNNYTCIILALVTISFTTLGCYFCCKKKKQ